MKIPFDFRNRGLTELPILNDQRVYAWDLSDNPLITLKGLPEVINGCLHLGYCLEYLNKNSETLKSLKYLPKHITGSLFIENSDLITPELWRISFVRIDGYVFHTNLYLERLIRKYQNTGSRGALRFQQELIELELDDPNES